MYFLAHSSLWYLIYAKVGFGGKGVGSFPASTTSHKSWALKNVVRFTAQKSKFSLEKIGGTGNETLLKDIWLMYSQISGEITLKSLLKSSQRYAHKDRHRPLKIETLIPFLRILLSQQTHKYRGSLDHNI